MKSVWLIEAGSYSDYRVVGVFSTKAAAQTALDSFHDSDGEINEWEVNPGVKHLNAGRWKYRVLMLRDGTVESCARENHLWDFDESHSIWDRPNAPAYKGKNIPACLQTTVWARNPKHAVKITNEIRTRMIAENKWKP